MSITDRIRNFGSTYNEQKIRIDSAERHNRIICTAESIEWFIEVEDQPISPSYDLAPTPPPLRLSRQ